MSAPAEPGSTGPVGNDRERRLAVRVRRARESGVVGGRSPITFLRGVLVELETNGSTNRALMAETCLALAWFEAMAAGPTAARSLMDRAVEFDPGVQWQVDLQWAGMLIDDPDRHLEAMALFDRVLPLLPPGRHRVIALNNRGVLNNVLGRAGRAAADARAAADLAEQLELVDYRSAALHNLGIADHYAGDLPGALAHMKAARLDGARMADGAREVDRGRVLYDAGLMFEAAEAAETAVRLAARSRWTNDLALAHLLGARAYAAIGEFDLAMRHARRASRVFRRRGSDTAADGALLVQLRIRLTRNQAALESGVRSALRTAAAIADQAEILIDAFLLSGSVWESAAAKVIAVAARQDAGHWARAAEIADTIGSVVGAPLAQRLDQHWIDARAQIQAGRTGRGLAALREGLDELHRFQARLGSQDLQTATAIHGVPLADLALRTVLANGRAELLLDWIERTRAVTSRLPTVLPPADPELAANLSRLRALAGSLRSSDLDGAAIAQVQEKATGLRREIRSRAWMGTGSELISEPAGRTVIARALASAGNLAVEFLTFDRQLYAVVVTASRVYRFDLGPMAPVQEALHRLGADLDLLALRLIPPTIREAAVISRNRLTTLLAELLVRPWQRQLDGVPADGTITVAAVGELAGLAWNLLPGLAGRSVRVNPSLSVAVRSVEQQSAPDGPRRVLVVWGPDVPQAAREIDTLGALYPQALVLAGADATGDRVTAEISRFDLVHVASHGNHEPENPLFSALHLHDGPLMAYDLARVALPSLVVLSACDVGRNSERPGGEVLGMVMVLLRAGVSTVIAATARIADDDAADTLSDFHRRLARGQQPAAALAAAVQAQGSSIPLVCFGR